mmetsp:Transcript_16658/g.33582  ORF Transcript_16658/g.33582 Transcript_16658/m.33582 type:complete len:434 (-) Transcript_16658:223-1524(-)|eukprot:CAMPEP_0174728146 /NCGR_PEP_ID=MMETSP1094-20130205/51170_1 /TAXON_ID=156173 /ORGANISM="Chrysochromulina brevifilum, Strain UTEX LB 985" /LENGTH=433 /DNA_ID=CAMNT_0015930013 /DNA_START=28 /DNA_END=1329 /DNA_ORIENTATION=-
MDFWQVPTLRQVFHYFRGDSAAKDAKLMNLLERSASDIFIAQGTAIVFCSGAAETQRVYSALTAYQSPPTAVAPDSPALSRSSSAAAPDSPTSFSAAPTAASPELYLLHEQLSDEERATAQRSFRPLGRDGVGAGSILVCSELAARGLDFPQVRHVILYSMPQDVATYVHCVGRTARRGAAGRVTCLVSSASEVGQYRDYHALQPAQRLTFGDASSSQTRKSEMGMAEMVTQGATADGLVQEHPRGEDLYVFVYGSLMWAGGSIPHVVEKRSATLRGHRRSLCLYSWSYRGSREAPGLVLGLESCVDPDAACVGSVLRVKKTNAIAALAYFDEREQINSIYIRRAVDVQVTDSYMNERTLRAHAYVADPNGPQFCGLLSEAEAAQLVATGVGTRGTALEYLEKSVEALRGEGVTEEGLEAVLRCAKEIAKHSL